MLIGRLWPSIVWAIIILILTGVPGNYFPKVTTFWEWLSPDKIVHIIIFGVQTILLFFAFHKQYATDKQRYVSGTLVIIISVLFALLTEVLQKYLFIGRYGSVYDFIANVVGVFAGFLAYYLLYFKKKKANN